MIGRFQNFREVLRAFLIMVWCAAFATPAAVLAQYEVQWTHPELQWHSIETEHFFVHFHEGAEQTAKITAKIGEEVYEPITRLYEYQPDGKIHFVIKDYDDFSNGAAYYFDNKVEIWASALDFELRGTHHWLHNVVTHEFIHMIQLGSARKGPRLMPAIYLQGFAYEDEKRPDVLLGYPNVIASYPILLTTVPPWFAEGVAQYQVPGWDYDSWDSHRDMLLRTAVVEDKLLTYSAMGVFAKNSIGSERIYNQGYSLSAFIVERYGVEALGEISRHMQSALRFSFDSAIKKATGKSGADLYDEWKSLKQETYAAQLRHIRANEIAGTLLQDEGTGNFYPRWSPDGKSLAYLTNQGADYLGMTALVIRDQTTQKKTLVKVGVHHAFDWSPDGTKLAYARKSDKNPHHSAVYDLYVYDTVTKKETRLTHALRAHSPNWSPDASQLACVVNGDGTQNLAVFDLKKRSLRMLTSYNNQQQAYTPDWSPDGKAILYSYSATAPGRDILLYDLGTGKNSPLLDDSADSRDAVFSDDGRMVYFSWDKTGIFNIHRLNLATRETAQLTNVVGGAFMPGVNHEGELAFSSFVAEGYKIASLQQPQPVQEEHTQYLSQSHDEVKLAAGNGVLANLNLSGAKVSNSDEAQASEYDIQPYKKKFTSISILPRLTLDYGTVKVGTYLTSRDMLDKTGFTAGFAVNTRKDYDAFLLLDYNELGPNFYLEAFNQVLNTTFEDTDVRYDLALINLGLRHSFTRNHLTRFGFGYSRYNAKLGFEVRGVRQSFGYTYHIGKALELEHHYRVQPRAVDAAINPRTGRDVRFFYAREWNDYLNSDPEQAFRPTEYGTFVEVYVPNNLHRFELEWKERVPTWGRTGLTLYTHGGLLSHDVESFYYFFAGGLPGVRGYPFYSMEGRYLMHGRLTYRFPLIRKMDLKFLHVYFDQLYAGVSYDYGGAFVDTKNFTDNLHDSITLQLRLDSYSFYGLPSRVFFDASYGLDRFKFRGSDIEFGKEWRFYFGLLFDFLDD